MRAGRLVRGILFCLLMLATEHAAGQSFQLRLDNISAASGAWSASGYALKAVAGQPAPLRVSSNENNILVPGFIAGISNFDPCSGNAVARVAAPPMPPAESRIDALLLIDMSGVPAPDSLLGSFTGSVSWDPAQLSYVEHSAIQSGYVGVVNTTDAADGFLEFNGTNPAGAGGNVPLFGLRFDVVGAEGDSGIIALNYSDIVAAGTFQNLLGCLTVRSDRFRIAPASPCFVCGDVTGDSTATSSDALVILSSDVGVAIPQDLLDRIDAGCGDVNGDSVTNSSDALIILSYDVGLPVPFDVGSTGGCGASSNSTSAQLPNHTTSQRAPAGTAHKPASPAQGGIPLH
jgi:hypothetical protein